MNLYKLKTVYYYHEKGQLLSSCSMTATAKLSVVLPLLTIHYIQCLINLISKADNHLSKRYKS